MGETSLFRMTSNRRMILEGILTSVMLNHELTIGYARDLIEKIPDASRREARRKESEEEEEKWIMVHDVLSTVYNHNNQFHLNLYRIRNRTWMNERDIPKDLFDTAITEALNLIKLQQERLLIRGIESDHKKKIHLLEELLHFKRKIA